MNICETCDSAIKFTVLGRVYVDGCEIVLNKEGKSTYDDLPEGCPLAEIRKEYKPGDSRAQKFINDNPTSPLMMSEGKFYPAKFNKFGTPEYRCAEDDGYIKKCDSSPGEDCRDCWQKEYKE